MVELAHVIISWDLYHTVPTLEFKFNFTLPEPRKMRIIAKRDEYGRIVRSVPPEMSFEPASKPFYGLLQG